MNKYKKVKIYVVLWQFCLQAICVLLAQLKQQSSVRMTYFGLPTHLPAVHMWIPHRYYFQRQEILEMRGRYMLGREADNELSVRGKIVLIRDYCMILLICSQIDSSSLFMLWLACLSYCTYPLVLIWLPYLCQLS